MICRRVLRCSCTAGALSRRPSRRDRRRGRPHSRAMGIEFGHTDTDGTSALYVPSTGLLVGGDAVYGEVHLYLAESSGDGRRRWLDALATLEQLRPAAVVAGHRRPPACRTT